MLSTMHLLSNVEEKQKGFFPASAPVGWICYGKSIVIETGSAGFTVVIYSLTSGLLQVKNEDREEVFLLEVILSLVLIHIPWGRD